MVQNDDRLFPWEYRRKYRIATPHLDDVNHVQYETFVHYRTIVKTANKLGKTQTYNEPVRND